MQFLYGLVCAQTETLTLTHTHTRHTHTHTTCKHADWVKYTREGERACTRARARERERVIIVIVGPLFAGGSVLQCVAVCCSML